MVPIYALWLPILVSAVLVFFVSWAMHMLLPLHRADFRKLPAEDEVMEALRRFEIPPGDYMMPLAGSPANMRTPEFKAKLERGPVAIMTVYPRGQFQMGTSLVQWFAFLLLIGVFAAYLGGRVLGHEASYLRVFRIVGTTAFMGHWLAQLQDSIWHRRNWGTTLRFGFDGLVYALLTAGTFGWLWPR